MSLVNQLMVYLSLLDTLTSKIAVIIYVIVVILLVILIVILMMVNESKHQDIFYINKKSRIESLQDEIGMQNEDNSIKLDKTDNFLEG